MLLRFLTLFTLIFALSTSPIGASNQGSAHTFKADKICLTPKNEEISLTRAEQLYREGSFDDHQASWVSTIEQSIWIRCELTNRDDFASTYVIKCMGLFVDQATLFYRSPEGPIRSLQSGENLPIDQKNLYSEEQLFLLNIPSKQTQIFYLHLNSADNVFTGIEAHTLNEYYAFKRTRDRIAGLYFGIFGALLLLTGIAHAGNPRRDFKLYLGFLTSILLALTIYQNLHLTLLPWIVSPWHAYIIVFFGGLAAYFQIQFTWQFLSLDKAKNWLKILCRFLHYITVFACIAITITILIVLIAQTPNTLSFSQHVIKGVAAILAINCFIMPFIGFGSLYYGNREARFYITAFICLFAGAMPLILTTLQLKQRSDWDLFSIQMGSGLQVIFFAFALADKLFLLRNERNAAKDQAEIEADRRKEVEKLAKEIIGQKVLLENQSDRIQKTNQELQKSNQGLADLNRQKREFLGIAVHDLKSPLSGIIGSVSLLYENEADPKNAKLSPERRSLFFVEIERTARQMLASLDSLLEANATDQTQREFEYKEVDLGKILRESIDWNSAHAQSKKIHLSIDIADELVTSADSRAVSEIFDNLISNALKYSPTQSNVSIFAHASKDDIIIRITDSGPGFTEDDQAFLYLPYSKLTATPTDGESSSGLGLSIVKHYLDAHKGSIHLETELLKGSTFEVRFPIRPDHLEA